MNLFSCEKHFDTFKQTEENFPVINQILSIIVNRYFVNYKKQ